MKKITLWLLITFLLGGIGLIVSCGGDSSDDGTEAQTSMDSANSNHSSTGAATTMDSTNSGDSGTDAATTMDSTTAIDSATTDASTATVELGVFIGSCNLMSSGQACIDYYGSFWTMTAIEAACSGGTASTEPCNTSGCLGSCTQSITATAQWVTNYFYNTGGIPQSICDNAGGSWSTSCN